jgi:hypothetical protein
MTFATERSLDFATAAPSSQVVRSTHCTVTATYERYVNSGDYPFERYVGRLPGGTWSDLVRAAVAAQEIETILDSAPHGECPDGNGVFEIAALETILSVRYDADYSGWRLEAAAKNPDNAARALDIMLGLLPPVVDRALQNELECTVWMHHPMAGATYRRKIIDRLSWDAVDGNYPTSIDPSDDLATRLEGLCSITTPPDGGRLMLFHGPPGTGKTRFIQTMATEWSDWCDLHYIFDPDLMFESAMYLNSVILDSESSERWRLIVLEDGDEFIDVGAKEKVGQGLSRLLNVADGFIGQATRLLILISTNVEHEAFHEAAIRNGRCFANVEFPAFDAAGAQAWAKRRYTADNSDLFDPVMSAIPDEGEITLADLYHYERLARAAIAKQAVE